MILAAYSSLARRVNGAGKCSITSGSAFSSAKAGRSSSRHCRNDNLGVRSDVSTTPASQRGCLHHPSIPAGWDQDALRLKWYDKAIPLAEQIFADWVISETQRREKQ